MAICLLIISLKMMSAGENHQGDRRGVVQSVMLHSIITLSDYFYGNDLGGDDVYYAAENM
ncbi:hypothetical protein BTK70_18940 [Cronobacter sakazakii]|nr:hypothetical protein BTK70_18940 [Cronobacter sakazakii]PUY13597.1 hypothetical protein BTK72_18190 [Cronobacter sakazakii]